METDHQSITPFKLGIADFVRAGDRAYLTGFASAYFGKGMFIRETSIIKENGEWKFYGNRREAPPW